MKRQNNMTHTTQNKTSLITAGVVTFSLLFTVLSANFAYAANSNSAAQIKVKICHATGSASNPFTTENPNDDAVDGNGNGSSDHNRNDHQNGEDIIPPGSWDADGRNWTAQNQAIWNNNCNIPTVTSTPTPTNTVTPTNTPTITPTPTSGGSTNQVSTITPTASPSATITPTPTTGTVNNSNSSTQNASESTKTVESIQLTLADTDMASTGTFIDTIMRLMFGIGSFTTGLGFLSFKKQK
jgi:hypothetical protein